MLEDIFVKIIGMSLTASIIIIVVLIVRALLKRFPKFISYGLWSVVLFRLLCPVSFETSFSPVPNVYHELYEYTVENSLIMSEGMGEYAASNDSVAKNDLQMDHTTVRSMTVGEENKAEISWKDRILFCGKYVWILGICVMSLYAVISFARIRQKVLVSVPLQNNIYIADEIMTPFVMGVIHPKIYLPDCLSKKEQKYIILHEQIHIKRLDHVTKLVAYLTLCIHWFNPFVWLAFVLFCKDMEMSCDEAVIKKMGEEIRADYADSLLVLSVKRHWGYDISVTFGEGDTKGRVKNLATFRQVKKSVLAVTIAGVIVLIVCLAFNHKAVMIPQENVIDAAEVDGIPEAQNEIEGIPKRNVSLNISEHYITNTGDPSNLYYIDENKVLWGCGRNNCGQLGQGTQDYDFHNEMVKIAENVIHVDYSQEGYTIFLTEDNKLYGMGNAGSGALQQYEAFDWDKYVNQEHYYISEPYLLMEDVIYARCGRDDIVCLKQDGTVWTWGTIYIVGGYGSSNVYYIEKPEKILENAVLVTGGWFNHAALLQNGTVWTWGYNSAGNCGIADAAVVHEPTMVAEDVVMVWTGSLKYNVECQDIAEFDGFYPKYLNNTVIRKADGSIWICGENVGTEEKMVSGAEGEYSIVCTNEFQLYE